MLKLRDYKYPSIYSSPFDHQVRTVEFILDNPRNYNLSTMGTGKTLSSLWAADYLMLIGAVKSVLIVCPLSTMSFVWANEISLNLPHRRFAILHGSKQQRLQQLARKVDYYIINHDGIKIIEEELKRQTQLVIVDEATAYKNWSSERTKSLKRITDTKKGVWSLTGSPTSNSPLEAFGIAKVTTPNNPHLPQYYTEYRDLVTTKFDDYTFIPKLGWELTVNKILSPSIRFVLEECVDMPEMVEEHREYKMSAEQAAMYKAMKTKLLAEYSAGVITAANAGVKALKLLQISSGAVYDENKNLVVVDNSAKLNGLLDIILESGKKKVIVFSTFRGSLQIISEFLSKHGITNGVVHGDVSSQARSKLFTAFQHGDLNSLVMQPKATAHGLTLTASSLCIWFTPHPSNEIVQQANARIRRPGQKYPQLVVSMSCSPAENKVYKMLALKETMSNIFLRLVCEED